MSLKEGTRVLVTAGASGIGLATAKLFKDNGALVQICDVSESHLETALREIPGLYGSQVDVADLAQVDKLFDDVKQKEKEREDLPLQVPVNSLLEVVGGASVWMMLRNNWISMRKKLKLH